MNTHNDGGQAFPGQFEHGSSTIESWSGMTMRDYFAAKAMEALLINAVYVGRELAEYAYRIADDMLKARNK